MAELADAPDLGSGAARRGGSSPFARTKRRRRRDHRSLRPHHETRAAGGAVPEALSSYIAGRKGYDYNEHGRAGNTHTDFVPDEIIDRFCLLGNADEHIEKLEQLKALGVDQFAGYLQHDNKEETLRVYGETVIPALADHVTAKR